MQTIQNNEAPVREPFEQNGTAAASARAYPYAGNAGNAGLSSAGSGGPAGAVGAGYAGSAGAGYWGSAGNASYAGYYAGHAAPPKTPYAFSAGDGWLAAAMLVLGFLCWEWGFQDYASTLGRFLFFLLAACVTFVYMRSRGVRQNAKSLAALAVFILGDLPFLLYDGVDINFFLVVFVCAAFLLWIAYATGTEVSKTLSGFILSDWLNQTFAVPFANFGGLFGSVRERTQDASGVGGAGASGVGGAGGGAAPGAQSARKGGGSRRGILHGVIGVAVSLPILAAIIALLVSADDGFGDFVSRLSAYLDFSHVGIYILEFVCGIPVACYLFGSVHGNVRKRKVDCVTAETTAKSLAGAHKIPSAAVCAPLVALNAVYVVFFIVMGNYLFSAFSGNLPGPYTYAEYARKGFFELCGVSAINLVLLAFVYAFMKRGAKEYPKAPRVLSGTLSVLTALLVTTALSKMLLYIDAYGLSRLRVYTFWFMIVLLLVFVALIVWHVRPYNAGRPIVLIAVVMTLALFLGNTDGLVARYNVNAYEAGRLETIDTEMLAQMSDAAVPWLAKLRDEAPDAQVRAQAADALARRPQDIDSGVSFRRWNLQTAQARELAKEE
jgi:hypothetical protein